MVSHTLRMLAEVQPTGEVRLALDRDPGEGIGLLMVVSGSRSSSGWRIAQGLVDPTLTVVSISTDVPAQTVLDAAARTEDEFLTAWSRLVGRGRLDLEADADIVRPTDELNRRLAQSGQTAR